MKTLTLLRNLANFFPKKIGKKYHDPIGLQTGKLKENTNNILLCLDFDEIVYNKFFPDNININGIDLIITHHPFIFGTKKIVFANDVNKKVLCDKIDQLNIPIYSFHTNFDEGKNGMNDALASKLNLRDIRPLNGDPMARGGNLGCTMKVNDFAIYAKNKLNTTYGLLLPYGKSNIATVAIVGGGGWRSFKTAKNEGYDIFISGDIPHHGRREVISYQYNYLDLPHEIENVFMEQMKTIIKTINPNLTIFTIEQEEPPTVI